MPAVGFSPHDARPQKKICTPVHILFTFAYLTVLMTTPLVLTITEAAKAIRCRRTVLEQFIRTGELTAFSVGGQRGTRISRRALEAFMQKRALRTSK
jgi:excisionase family DNA binding protein